MSFFIVNDFRFVQKSWIRSEQNVEGGEEVEVLHRPRSVARELIPCTALWAGEGAGWIWGHKAYGTPTVTFL